MSRRFHTIFTAVFIFSSACVLAGPEDSTNADALLRSCKQSLLWTDSMSLHVYMQVRSTRSAPACDRLVRDYTFRRHADRAEWFGKIITYDPEGNIGENTFSKKQVATGSRFFEISNLIGKQPERALMQLDYKQRLERLLDDADTFGPLLGRTTGIHHKTLIDVLSEAENLSISDAQEQINGIPCYKLHAETKYGRVALWTSPEKGYNSIKWSIHQTPEHYIGDKLIADIKVGTLNIKNRLKTFEITQLTSISETFVPTRANYTFTIEFTDGTVHTNTYEYKVDNIQLNPDFDAIGAFSIDLQDGTPVTIKEHPGIKYVWQNGKIAPAEDMTFEEIDKMVDELKK